MTKTGILLLVAASAAAYGQDAAMQAAQMASQMATQAAQMANDQAMQAAQTANQQAMQANQMAAQSNSGAIGFARRPAFSVPSGQVQPGTMVRLKCSTRHAVIYYTTDGWTPSLQSTRYIGPITISSSMTLQAIAVSSNGLRSRVLSANFIITGSKPQTLDTTFPANAYGAPAPMPGAILPLVFTSSVSSRNLQVGDNLPVTLAQDVTVGGKLIASKGAPVLATVTQVDNSGKMGLPGTLSFEVHALTLADGTQLPLYGAETKEGRSHMGTAGATSLIVPFGGLFVHGENAEIAAGATLTATVAAPPIDKTSTASDINAGRMPYARPSVP